MPGIRTGRIILPGHPYEGRIMGRAFSLSVLAGLALCAAGSVSAQSRTVSTANMPKPGVSYISGPSTPVRKETVSTGTLPQPAQLHVGGQVSVGGGGYTNQDGYGSDSSVYYGGGYGGGYPGGYDGDGHGGRDHDHGRPGHDGPGNGHGDHDHDHGQRPADNSGSLAAHGGGNASATGGGVRLAPDRNDRDDNGWNRRGNDRGDGWNNRGDGWNNNNGRDNLPPVQPGTGTTNSRAPLPGTGVSNSRGPQPGTGVPMNGGGGWHGR